MTEILKAALWYAEKKGYSVIPCKQDKKPAIRWQEWQNKRADREQIEEWWKRFPGTNVGIVTGKISNLAVIDIDEPIGEEELDKLIPESAIIPTSTTPRGGKHLYFSYPADIDLRNNTRVIPGCDVRAEGGYIMAPPSINGKGGVYSWIAGLGLHEVATIEIPPKIINIILSFKYNSYIHTKDSNITQGMTTNDNKMFQKGQRDNDLFHIANSLVKGGCNPGYVRQVLEILALNCKPPFPLTEINDKIQSALERAKRKERNLTEDIREWILTTNDNFLTTNVYKCLQLTTREQMKAATVILGRFAQPGGIIERTGDKRGSFRVIQQELATINFLDASTAPYPINLPFQLEDLVEIHKSNIIVVAGESNAGKTAFCLNIAKMNRNLQPVNYLSSEMNEGTELRIRLEKFQIPLTYWDPNMVKYRLDNFPDVIQPDALNIIDYLDEGEEGEAYKMAYRIRKIAAKLKNGIAVIALQKKSDKEWAFGGEATMNTARLYITLTRKGILRVVKAKIWKSENTNPNGLFCNFKLAGGCKFIKTSGWNK